MNHVFKCTAFITVLLISTGLLAMERDQSESEPVNLAILISGGGTNMAAILDAIKNEHGIVPKVVISNKKEAAGLEKARQRGVIAEYLPKMKVETREQYGDKLIVALEKSGLTPQKRNLICLAGFMLVLPENIVTQYKDQIINIHPALLPSFKGAHGIEDAFNYGAKVTGPTVHFVDNKMDTGPIIMQESFPIEEADKLEDVALKMHKSEHNIFPKCVKLYVEKRLQLTTNKTGRRTVHILPE